MRLRAYIREVFRRGRSSYTIDFDALARRLEVSRRTIERGVSRLRSADQFSFRTLRIGRSFAVEVSDRHPAIKGVFSPSERKEETRTTVRISGNRPDRKAAGRGLATSRRQARTPLQHFRPHARRTAALAACVSRRDLAGLHWDNCKVRFRFPHAFLFAFRALLDGHSIPAIVRAYDGAVHQRHQDATDYDLNHGSRLEKWEPSSTVSLADELLSQDRRSVAERWAEFLGIGATPPPGWQPMQPASAFCSLSQSFSQSVKV